MDHTQKETTEIQLHPKIFNRNRSHPLKALSRCNRQISRQFSFAFAYQLCRSYSAE